MKEVFKRKYRALHGAAKIRMLLLVIMIIPAMAAGCGKQEHEFRMDGADPAGTGAGDIKCAK